MKDRTEQKGASRKEHVAWKQRGERKKEKSTREKKMKADRYFTFTYSLTAGVVGAPQMTF